MGTDSTEAPSLIADQGASATYDAPGVPVIQQGSAIHSSYGDGYGDGYLPTHEGEMPQDSEVMPCES